MVSVEINLIGVSYHQYIAAWIVVILPLITGLIEQNGFHALYSAHSVE